MSGIELIAGALLGVTFQQLWSSIKELNAANNLFKLGIQDQVVSSQD